MPRSVLLATADTRDEDGLPPLRPRKAGSRRWRDSAEGAHGGEAAALAAALHGAAGTEGAAAAPVPPAMLHTARRRAQLAGGQKAGADAQRHASAARGGGVGGGAAANGRAAPCRHPRTPQWGPQQQHEMSGRTRDQNTRQRDSCSARCARRWGGATSMPAASSLCVVPRTPRRILGSGGPRSRCASQARGQPNARRSPSLSLATRNLPANEAGLSGRVRLARA